MKSRTTARFRRAFQQLPEDVQRQAGAAYALFTENPEYPGLRFKRIHSTRPVYSVRISREYRALGVREGGEMVWFWIGSHAAYDHLIARL